MSVPAFRNSRSKVRRRRAHHALTKVQVETCAKCGTAVLPHRACLSCGHYKGRQVLNTVEKVLEKKEKTVEKKASTEAKGEEKKATEKKKPAKKAAKESK